MLASTNTAESISPLLPMPHLGQVFHGIPFKPGDVILTSLAEYGSNYLAYLQVGPRMSTG